MRIKTVHIENFRSIRELECEFDDITTFVGPNGSGKSTILRALNWFFNGDKGSIGEEDIHVGAAPVRRVRVRVDFSDLTAADRTVLGPKYAAAEDSVFTAWRTWDDGDDKLTGKALALPEFEDVRRAVSAVDKRSVYNQIRGDHPEYSLPAWTSAAAIDAAMTNWESEHPDLLVEAEVSDTHFFGFNGRGKLAELFDFVFVSADFRASDEVSDTKDSILGKILQRAVDRSELQTATDELTARFNDEYNALSEQHLGQQLKDLSEELTSEIGIYARAHAVQLSATLPAARPQSARIAMQISDSVVSTPVERQGHGIQRSVLVGSLTVLSRRSRHADSSAQMFLAIEEPELFQHPTQAKAFASVLRAIASVPAQAIQIAYATHSPYFVDPRYFDQVRRVTTTRRPKDLCAFTRITTATLDGVCERLEDYMKADAVRRRWEQVCLKDLPEALFAETVILVEGDEDAAILQGLGAPANELALGGICVAPVSGKNNMMIPYAILSALEIQTLMVVDNDSGVADRMRARRRDQDDIDTAVTKQVSDNRALCRLVGAPEADFPVGDVAPTLVFIPDTMETLLASDLPGWEITRLELIKNGRGVDGKNAATYELAARECDQDSMGSGLTKIVGFVLGAAA